MRILFIVPYVPNLVRVRPFNLIRSLAQRGHAITLATLWSRDEEQDGLRELESCCEAIVGCRVPTWRSVFNSLAAVPSGQPMQAAYAWSPALARRIEALIQPGNSEKSFDVIHVEHLRGVKYGLDLQAKMAAGLSVSPRSQPWGKRIPIVWDSVDCISYLFRQSAAYSKSFVHRLVTRLDLERTEAYEAYLLEQFARVLVTSQLDREALIALTKDQKPRENLCVIPNGVDLDYFFPDKEVTREDNSIVVSGKMSYHANITMVLHLVEKIMPMVWARRPEAHLWVVGKDPSSELRALSANGKITVTGTVEDIRPYLRRAALSVAPLVYGAGIQNKVLESMACGTPVVASSNAVAAIQAQPGKDLCVASDPQGFAENILELLDNPHKRNAIGEAGRTYVVDHHHWGRIAESLEEVYHAVE